jgi:acyl-CoA synthetase (AMP-forming)/AMP-acid ligase II
MTFVQIRWLRHFALHTPESVALDSGAHRIGYADLALQMTGLASQFRNAGLRLLGRWYATGDLVQQAPDGVLSCLVSFQASNAACSLALKPDGVVASRRHSPSYDSSSRLGVFAKSSSGRKWSIGVSCKAQSTAIPVGIASICNAADHFKRAFYGWRGLCEHALANGLDGGAIKRHFSPEKILGRADQQLKIDGFRIEPGEIELALINPPPPVKDAVVTAIEPACSRSLGDDLLTHLQSVSGHWTHHPPTFRRA